MKVILALVALAIGVGASAQKPDPAKLFGVRQSIEGVSLSPDGSHLAYIAPEVGQGSALYNVDLATGRSTRVTGTDGNPQRIGWCSWSANDRIICGIYGVAGGRMERYLTTGKNIAIDPNGKNIKLFDGGVIDWLPNENGKILVATGGGIDKIDTYTTSEKTVESGQYDLPYEFITDGQGNVRIRGLVPKDLDYQGKVTSYNYRLKNSREWLPFSKYDFSKKAGLNPYAVDPKENVAYCMRKLDGRMALYKVSLDGSMHEQLVLSNSQVDIDRVLYLGRARRVIGASFITDKRQTVYFDPEIAKLVERLSRALPHLPKIQVAGASTDESKLLLWAGSDTDPGRYYLYEKASRTLKELMLTRPELEGVTLSSVTPVTYRATDGTIVPAYLTLPPGQKEALNLPAIVMPHGGPGSRDEWGFDWLAQFYAASGFAVLQPEFRGSTGYGDAWFQKNGFQSWRLAVGDVVDGGRWLISSGIADPKKLAVVGWSYGGYAALQANVIDPNLFRAIIAIAPVTDLSLLKEESRGWSDFRINEDFIGGGSHIIEGSPAKHADMFKAPVLIFQGTVDSNVDPAQARLMDSRLAAAGKNHTLILYPKLDHYLEDSVARIDMLSKSGAFLRLNLGL